MFTTGRLLFVAVFAVAFIGGLIWAYRKDAALHRIHYKRSYLVLFALIGFITLMFLLVKLRKFMF